MDYKLFKDIVEEVKNKKPVLFALESDEIPSQADIDAFEKENGITLPQKYKEFILEFGGGYFGFANIYSLDKSSAFYLLKHNNLPFKKYLKIADNGCGDYYVLKIENAVFKDKIYLYNNEENSIYETEYTDILEYLVKVGLKYDTKR